MASSTEASPSRYGRVDIKDLGTEEFSHSTRPERKHRLRVMSYRWTPPPDLQRDFHPDFSIGLHAHAGPDGKRRFLPTEGVDSFIDRAFSAGLAMLTRDRQLSSEHTGVFRVMKLIFDRVRRMREHMDREFGHSRDLYIRQLGRETDSDRSVLPERIGKTAAGAGRTWTPKILCEEGQSRARDSGVEANTGRVKISYGLLAAAERNPMDIKDSEVAPLVRIALFSPAEEEETLSDDYIAEVLGRLTDLLVKHQYDEEEDFQRWYADNLFKAVAGKDRSVSAVRKAILQLGWQAYEYVGNCVSYYIQAFVRSLPISLSAIERELLNHMYQPQSYLGGIPLVLLLERWQIFDPLIGRLWESPGDPQSVRVLHRLLSYYAEMASHRRIADVKSKKARKQLEIATSDLAESQAVAVEGSHMERILDRISQRRNLCCDWTFAFSDFKIN